MELDFNIYTINDIDTLLEDNFEFIKTNKKVQYMNVACSLDIESTSFLDEEGNKSATMYAFVLGINGKCIIGRTYDELIFLLNKVSKKYALDMNKRVIFYVHNLSYEWQFFRKWFNWTNVFALDKRKVAYALSDIGIELRCSYILSGYPLSGVSDILTKYKVNKMVGDLDYSLLRHCKTHLTDKELGYILHDGLVVMAYIQEQIEQSHNNISFIPLTKTGRVREYCRKMCLWDGTHRTDKHFKQQKYYRYRNIMKSLQIKSVQEYEQLKRAFQGGFTHANAFYVGSIAHDVTSYDFTSSYPAVMVMERFPMSSAKIVKVKNKKEFQEYLDLYCCIFDIEFTDIEPLVYFEHPISSSKCVNIEKGVFNNGRVVKAHKLTTTITDVDYEIFKKFYKWKSIRLGNFRIYRRGYLPTDFVKSILNLYQQKTTLKGVEGREVDYLVSKENLNSCYGMSVTDICQNNLEYNDEIENEDGGWISNEVDVQKTIEKYNNSKRRFLFYPWGVFVTAYARRNLFSGIYECKNDYVYSDTDSIKCVNMDDHMDYIKRYNEHVVKKLKLAMNYHGLTMDLVSPKTIEGKIKTIGLWDYDGHYDEFSTLGAKRYMVRKGDEYSFTISGLNKKFGIPYLKEKYGNPFDAFKEGMYIPSDATGKNTHTYIDFEQQGQLTDYLGVTYNYYEKSSIHISGCDYEMSLARDFIDYLKGLEEIED